MPILSSQSGISAKAFGLTSSQFASFGDGYWGQVIYKTSSGSYNMAGAPSIDSSNNIFLGTWYTEVDQEAAVLKLNSLGVIQWQKKISTPQTDFLLSNTLDSAGNFIVIGRSGINGAGYVAKFDTSGSLLWSKEFVGSFTNISPYSVGVDSSNNVYLAGQHYLNATNTWDAFVIKLDSSGNLQWQRFLGASGQQSINSIAVNSSGDIYVTGTLFDSSFNTVILAKYNSSGVLQWQKKLSHAISVMDGGISLDSSGNIYFAGSCGVGVLIKFDSSGNLQWQKASSISGTQWTDIHIDSSNNIYVIGFLATGLRAIVKYDTSGNVLYRRSLTGAAGFSGGISSKGSAIYISGLTYGPGPGTIGDTLYYLPADGSKTGVYFIGGWTVVYSGYNDTDVAGPVVVSTSTYTDSAGNFSFTTPTAAITNDTFTQTIQY